MSPAGEHGEDLCWMKLAQNVFQIKIQSPFFFVLLKFIYIVSIRMIYLATSSRGKERLQRPQFSKSFVGWLEPGHKIMVMMVMMVMVEMMVMVVMVVMMVITVTRMIISHQEKLVCQDFVQLSKLAFQPNTHRTLITPNIFRLIC